jgi:hypothetical protein
MPAKTTVAVFSAVYWRGYEYYLRIVFAACLSDPYRCWMWWCGAAFGDLICRLHYFPYRHYAPFVPAIAVSAYAAGLKERYQLRRSLHCTAACPTHRPACHLPRLLRFTVSLLPCVYSPYCILGWTVCALYRCRYILAFCYYHGLWTYPRLPATHNCYCPISTTALPPPPTYTTYSFYTPPLCPTCPACGCPAARHIYLPHTVPFILPCVRLWFLVRLYFIQAA